MSADLDLKLTHIFDAARALRGATASFHETADERARVEALGRAVDLADALEDEDERGERLMRCGDLLGEIGGPDEADAARWCKANMKKPIVGFIAGVTAPPGKRMGHAGALISGGADTADAKLAVMEECGFKVTRNPSEMAKLLKAML